MPCPAAPPGTSGCWSASGASMSRSLSRRRRAGLRARAGRRCRRSTPSSSATPARPAEPAPGCCSTRPASTATPPPRSTGTTRRATGGSWPTASPRAATSAACSGSSTSPPASTSRTRSPTPEPRRWAGCPTRAGFLYTRYPEDSEYGRRVYEHVLGAAVGRRPAGVGRAGRRPSRGPTSRSQPIGRPALVHVSVGWSAPTSTSTTAPRPTWRVVVEGVDERTAFGFDGDRLLGFTNIDAPRGRVVAATIDEPSELGDARARGRRRDRRRRAGRRARSTCCRPRTRVARLAAMTDSAPRRPRSRSPTWARSPGSTPTRPPASPSASSSRSPARRRCGGSTARCSVPPPRILTTPPLRREAPAFTVSRRRYRSADGTEVGLFLVHRCRRRAVGGHAGDPHRLRRLRHLVDAGVVAPGRGLVRAGRPLRRRRPAGRHRGGRGLARGRHAGQQAERLRRLRRRRRPPRGVRADVTRAARPAGRLERRPARGHGPDAAARPGPGRPLRRAAHRHGALPAVPHRPAVDPRVRRPGRPEAFAWLHAYSPYHHVAEGTCYPAVLFTTAEGDTRVDPNHARKMAAQLQWALVVPGRPPDPLPPGGPGRARRGQAAAQAGRRGGRRPGLPRAGSSAHHDDDRPRLDVADDVDGVAQASASR